jgi:Spy/CpxP family protein refolding chaperone
MSIAKSLLLSALISGSMATMAFSADAPPPPTEHGANGWHRPGGPGFEGPFMHVIHQLNLTADQQRIIDGYIQTAKQQHKANMGSMPNMAVLANPGDPNYAAALAEAKTAAVNHIQQLSDLEIQIYDVLTAEQKAQLPTVLAAMKAKHAEHHPGMHPHPGPPPAPAG